MHFFLNIPREESLNSGSQISSEIQTDNSKLQINRSGCISFTVQTEELRLGKKKVVDFFFLNKCWHFFLF